MSKIKFAFLWLLTMGFLWSASCLFLSSSGEKAGWIFAVIYSTIGLYYAAKEIIKSK